MLAIKFKEPLLLLLVKCKTQESKYFLFHLLLAYLISFPNSITKKMLVAKCSEHNIRTVQKFSLDMRIVKSVSLEHFTPGAHLCLTLTLAYDVDCKVPMSPAICGRPFLRDYRVCDT